MYTSSYAAIVLLFGSALADVPTNCPVSSLWGDWEFSLGFSGTEDEVTSGIKDVDGNYLNLGTVTSTRNFRFSLYDAVDDLDTGATGTFTSIYNQGFEITIYNQKWFAYYYFDNDGYNCSRTSVGWATDALGTTYVRIQATKTSSADTTIGQVAKPMREPPISDPIYDRQYVDDSEFIERVNERAAGIWTARHNQANEKYTLREMIQRGGSLAVAETVADGELPHFERETIFSRSVPDLMKRARDRNAEVHAELAAEKQSVPVNLDWRNVNGEDFSGPVDDQMDCGSCYSFGALGLLEARVRVMTNNAVQPKFSEQEVITCGQEKTYSQGCDGGWNFIVAGKYAQSVGVVEEHCAPYNTTEYYATGTCPDVSHCQRWYVSDYGYLGGYYGATEWDGGKAMMLALQDGPLAIGFNVEGDFGDYTEGVWFATGVSSEWNPIVPTNHAVGCVGYGVCSGPGDSVCGDHTPAGTPYWIGKNSWGAEWGNNGYFLIIRGVNEVGFESMPFAATPIPHF